MNKKFIGVAVLTVCLFSCLAVYAQDYNFPELVQTESRYILTCQYADDPASPAYGAINNIQGLPTWVVPRENAMAILGLIMASDILEDPSLRGRAQLAADYLVRIQEKDGSWCNQYNYALAGSGDPGDKESRAKSPTQTAEVMIAFYRLGYQPGRYAAMKKGAQYLLSCQRKGGDGALIGGGKDADGNFRSWRWASDNAYAYQALKAAEVWALEKGDFRFAVQCACSSRKILGGINTTLCIKNPYDPDFGVWYRVVNEKNEPIDPTHHDWINYAPQMLNVPARGAGSTKVGTWIKRTLVQEPGFCVWDDYTFTRRRSPGYTFQAVLCWRSLGQPQFYMPALTWALESGLWQVDPDENSIPGGWIDWDEPANTLKANWWERFIDTSFYAIAAYNGGYDFSVVPAFLRIGYSSPKLDAQAVPYYLKLKFEFPEEPQE